MISIVKSVPTQQDESDDVWIIWLDPSTDVNKNREAEQRLRSIISNYKKFTDVKPCQRYIERCSDTDEIVLVVTGQLGREIIPNVHELEQVVSIYIFCYNVDNHLNWAKQYTKVKGVVNNFNILLSLLAKEYSTQKKEDDPLPIGIFTVGADESTMDVNGQFVFSQILFDCLLRLKYNKIDQDELITNCKTEHKDNTIELKYIDDFQANYKPHKALQWYTKDIFLFKSLNTALRQQNIHMIFLFRQFICDIQHQLQSLKTEKLFKVYRGQMMSTEEIDRLTKSIGKLISINSFFSTTLKQKNAFAFLKNSRGLKRVVFEITADPKSSNTKPFADISTCSVYPDEAEVLFMIGTIFRLDSVEYDNRDFWIIQMTLSNEEEHGLRQVLDFMKAQIESGETNLRTLGKFLWRMGKFDLAERYFIRLLKQLQEGDPLFGILYGDLAELAALKGNYDASVQYQKKALAFKDSKDGTETKTAESLPIALAQQVTARPDAEQQSSTETRTATNTAKEVEAQQFQKWLENYVKQYVQSLAQQSATRKRHKNSVENFCYIVENQASITDNDRQVLRGLINFGFNFDDINSEECIKVFRSIQNERIILILSKNSAENLAKQIREEPYLSAIYILDPANEFYGDIDLKVYRGSFPNMNKIFKQLEKDLPPMTYDLSQSSSIPSNYTRASTFSYVQSLKFVLLETDEKLDLKAEMIEFCREKYADNPVQLKLIDEFENTAKPDNAIQWFSRPNTFVYKMVTRAFRVLDADILYKLRYIIQYMHRQIQSSSDREAVTVYRTVRLRKDLFKKMCSYENGVLSFNEFLFAQTEQTTDEPTEMNRETKLVHFHMNLEEGVPRFTVGDKSNEILLTIGTVFRIDSVKAIDEDTFIAKLTTNSTIQNRGPQISREAYPGIRSPFPLIGMVKLMRYRDLYYYLEYFANLLEKDQRLTGNNNAILSLAAAFHSIAGNYYDIKLYDEALVFYQKGLDLYLQVLSPDDTRLTPTYNNIGSSYLRKNMNEKALEYCLKAYEIQKNSDDPDIDSISTYLTNIAAALEKLGRHKEALKYNEIGLKISLKLGKNQESAEIAVKYFNLATKQYRAQMYAESLGNYEKCLEIELKCHSADNPTVASTYQNMATALEKLGRRQEARAAVEKAIERLLRTKNEDDEEVKTNRRYLKQIDQKLWMKSILNDS